METPSLTRFCLCLPQGVGRRKCLDYQREHYSHFSLCHDGADNRAELTRENQTVYQSDYMEKQSVAVPASAARFPRDHQRKSAEAAAAQAGEQFMWFGRHNSDPTGEPVGVLTAFNCSSSSNSLRLSQHRGPKWRR